MNAQELRSVLAKSDFVPTDLPAAYKTSREWFLAYPSAASLVCFAILKSLHSDCDTEQGLPADFWALVQQRILPALLSVCRDKLKADEAALAYRDFCRDSQRD